MIEWELLSPAEKMAVRELSLHNMETFQRIWFQIAQGERYIPNWHIKYICHELDQIVAGERGNTIFNVTPGSSKTETISIHFPPYCYLKSKKVRNLNISFADTLVKRNSKRVRDLMGSREWQELWPSKTGTSKDDEFQVLNEEGKVRLEMISKSMQGQITGSRGGYITPNEFSGAVVLDDPEKPDDLFSKVKRERGHTLAKNTIRSRRAHSDTPIIVIQQRLHAQDMTWFLMNGGMGIEFEQISIPALVTEEYGRSLPDWLWPHFERDVLSSEFVEIDGVKHYSFWPAKESVHDLVALREADPYTFESQYQQNPFALGGNVFDASWWQYYDELPDRFDYRFVTGDTAQKTGELNDYSVFCEWGKLGDKAYLIRGLRGKWKAPELKVNFELFIKGAWAKNKELGILRKIYIEDASSGTGLIQDSGRSTPIEITAVHRNRDKTTRAMDAAPVIRAGKVVLPRNDPFTLELTTEASAFTFEDVHKHDDILDNVMDCCNMELLVADDPVERMKRLAGLRK